MCGSGVGFRHGEHRAGGILGQGLALCAQGDFQLFGIDGLFAVAHSPDGDLFGVLLQCSGLVVVAVGALGHIRQGKAVAQGIIGHLGLAQGRHGLDAVAGVIVVDGVVAGQGDGLADHDLLGFAGVVAVGIQHRLLHFHNAQIVPDILILGALVCNVAGGLGDVQPVGILIGLVGGQFLHLQNIAAVDRYSLRTIVIFRYHIRRGHGKADVVAFPVRVVIGHIRGRRHVEAVLLGKVAGGAVGIGVLVDGRPLHSVLMDGDLCAVRFPGFALGAVQLALHRGFHRGHAENAVFFRLVQLDLGQVQSACGIGIIVRHVEFPGGGGSCRLAVGHHGAQGGQQVAVGVGGLHGKSVGVGRDRVGHGGAIAADLGLAAHGLGGFGDHESALGEGGVQGVQVFLAGVVHPGLGLGAGFDVVGLIIKQIAGKEVAGGVGLVHRHPDGQVIAESVHQRQGVIDGFARPGKVHLADGRDLGALDDGLRVADLAVGAAQHSGVAVCRAGHHVEHQRFALVSFQVHDGLGVFDERGAVAIRRVQLKGFAQGGAGGVGGLHLCPQFIMVHAFIRDGGPADLIAGLFGIAGIHGEHLAGLAHLLQAAQHGIDGGVGRADALGGAGGIAGNAQAHFIKAPAVAAARKVGIDIEGVAVGAVLVLDFAVGIVRQGDGLLRRRNHIAVFVPGFGHTVQRQLILGVAAAGSRLAGLGPGKGVGQLVVAFQQRLIVVFVQGTVSRHARQLRGLGNGDVVLFKDDLVRGIASPVAVVCQILAYKIQRGQVGKAVAVAFPHDFQAAIPGRRAVGRGSLQLGQSFGIGGIPTGDHIPQTAGDRHSHDRPVIIVGQGVARQVIEGKSSVAVGHNVLACSQCDVLVFEIDILAIQRDGLIAQAAAHEHNAVGGLCAADAGGKVQRNRYGQVVDGSAGNFDIFGSKSALGQAGVAVAPCAVVGNHDPGDRHIHSLVILAGTHPALVAAGGFRRHTLAAAKSLRNAFGRGIPVAELVGVAVIAADLDCDAPIGQAAVLHQLIVFIGIGQHQLLAELNMAALLRRGHQANLQLRRGQGADKLLPARSSCRAGTLVVDAGHADLEIAALPLGLTFKGKAGVVGIGLQQGGIADAVAVFIGLVNGDMVVDGRAAGGGGIPGHVITAVNTLVAGTGSITAFDFQSCGGIRGAVVQDIAVVALEHLISNIFLAGLVVTVDVIEEEQDLADIADIPFLRHRILGQILGIFCKDIAHRRSFREVLARQGGNIRATLFYSLHRDDRSAIA